MLLFLLTAAAPHPRTGPEPSDLALFAVAALAIWLIRRALRRRFARKPPTQD